MAGKFQSGGASRIGYYYGYMNGVEEKPDALVNLDVETRNMDIQIL